MGEKLVLMEQMLLNLLSERESDGSETLFQVVRVMKPLNRLSVSTFFSYFYYCYRFLLLTDRR